MEFKEFSEGEEFINPEGQDADILYGFRADNSTKEPSDGLMNLPDEIPEDIPEEEFKKLFDEKQPKPKHR